MYKKYLFKKMFGKINKLFNSPPLHSSLKKNEHLLERKESPRKKKADLNI